MSVLKVMQFLDRMGVEYATEPQEGDRVLFVIGGSTKIHMRLVSDGEPVTRVLKDLAEVL